MAVQEQLIEYKVAVRCFTFNHSKYINDTLKGFCIQQTNFPFVCMIVDDASTDGEQKLIRQYIDENFDMSPEGMSYKKDTDSVQIIFAQHKTNGNCYFAVLLLKENHYSKKKSKDPYLNEWQNDVDYIAYCEGDDYWIDATKLQKQYDRLEKNPLATMCHTAFQPVNSNREPLYRPRYEFYMERSHSGDCFYDLLVNGNYPLTLTTMFRKKVFESKVLHNCPCLYDYAWFMTAASMGEFEYLPEKTGCYRFVETGAISTGMVKDYGIQVSLYFLKLIKDGVYNHRLNFICKLKIYTSFLSRRFPMKNKDVSPYLKNFFNENKRLYIYMPFVVILKLYHFFKPVKHYLDITDK